MTPMWDKQCPRELVSCVVMVWTHIEVGRYLGSRRNGVVELGCNEAVQFGGRAPGIHVLLIFFFIWLTMGWPLPGAYL